MNYKENVGKRVVINSRRKTRLNGRGGTIVAFAWMGKRKNIPYYRVEQIDGLHPATSLLYKAQDLVFPEVG